MNAPSQPSASSSSGASPAQQSPSGGGIDLKKSLNLPKTAFAMKANLVQNEPASMKRWESMQRDGAAGLYALTRKARAGAPRFVFHDGPPYANGSIHMGHLMNKVLKDIVVRSRTMMGQDCPYVPGWDCHGLPIEHKVMQEMQQKGKLEKLSTLGEDQRRMIVRRECQTYAEKFVKLQGGQMQRLLTLADYADPYLTMKPAYEGATLEVLAGLLEQGLVYRALKPVHWSIANQTALAEAELEYEDRQDLSVYVDFEAADAEAVYAAFGLKPAPEVEEEDETDSSEGEGGSKSKAPMPGVMPDQRPCFMIWTTTPWTLPANLAIAVNPKFEYALVWVDGNITVLATALLEKVMQTARAEEVVILARTTGDKLVGLKYRHPFVSLERGEGVASEAVKAAGITPKKSTDNTPVFSILPADYVTLEDGTGLVHTAPGHGVEDYQTGLKVGLPIYCPVKNDGTYDESAPAWLRVPGVDVWKANQLVTDHLNNSGHLFYQHTFTHSYPHDWRSKTPVIFRGTYQWFVGVDVGAKKAITTGAQTIRAAAMDSTSESNLQNVKFVPDWGRNRMRGMLESRPDWCISRQRAWGLPIPAFKFVDASGQEHVLMTAASVRAVAKCFREMGSDAWFTQSAEVLLKGYDLSSDADAPAALRSQLATGGSSLATLQKTYDILDVWFESGSSWNAVMRERSGGKDFPIDLYLEGSDQHRGWFQLSLLPALGMMGKPPFKTLLTHGFMVDKDGKKMSKSLGNTLEVDDLMKDYGADVARWWVSSLAFENDVKVDKSYLDVAGESYRKVRNTLRFMLSNLYDFTASCDGKAGHCVPMSAIAPGTLDAWVLQELDTLSEQVTRAYEQYEFKRIHALVYDFCNDTLSSKYLAAVKDRLYCDKPDSPRRRRTQTVLWDITDALCKLLSPIMPHTADEAYRALLQGGASGAEASDACVHLTGFAKPFGVKADGAWSKVMAARERAMGAVEAAKKTLGVENPLDMALTIPDESGELSRIDNTDLADLLGVSRVAIKPGAGEPTVTDLRSEPRCERSWKRDGTVKPRAGAGGALLSDRDAEAVGV
ncbi:MAG: isoleucine--tRNA ligase [Phycisphaerales bacterium]|nr:isoleucine--tRNA ligase [Phycisphaerales bacterium]